MKIALVAICSDLDAKYYALEWIKYHKHIGFDDIFIYLNNVDKQTKHNLENYKLDYVHLIDWPGSVQQLLAYNDFIADRSNPFDWGLFIDVDEFFVPRGFKSAKEAFDYYKDYYAVAFNWKIFGSNGLEKADFSRGVIERFTSCQRGLNQHIKTALNFKQIRRNYVVLDDVRFCNPHFVGVASRAYFTIRADMLCYVHGPWAPADDFIASNWNRPYIAHYLTKSREEFMERRSRVRADTASPRDNLDEFWSEHNLNDEQSLEVVGFSKGGQQ